MSFLKPLKNVIDYIEETQSDWVAGNGLIDRNGTKDFLLPKKPEDLPQSLCEKTNCDADHIAWHVAIADIPAYPEYVFVVYRIPKRRANH